VKRAALIIFLLRLLSATALADNRADVLFKKGKKLLAEKKYADACAAFTDSDRLDPGIGAKLNVGKCFEEWGRLATAMRWYRDAEKAAKDAADPRVDKIHERIEALDPDVPRLTLHAAKGADASGVTLDGAPAVLEEAVEVDPGPHAVEYTSSSGEAKKKTVPVERGGSSDVTLDLAKRAPKPPVVVAPVVAETPAGHGQRIAGIAVGAGGVVAVVVASIVTYRARNSYRDALHADCMDSTASCDPDGLTATHDARHDANIATVIAVIGGAAIAGGVVIFLIAPHGKRSEEHALYLTPTGTGLALGGNF
jgi:hypothetical protein